jgi:hypothetical protein
MSPAGSTDHGSRIGVCTATPSVPLIGPEQEIAQRSVVGTPGHRLDHPPEQGEGGVVVGEELSERILLRELRQPVCDEARDAVVVLAGVRPVVCPTTLRSARRLLIVTRAAVPSSASLRSGGESPLVSPPRSRVGLLCFGFS